VGDGVRQREDEIKEVGGEVFKREEGIKERKDKVKEQYKDVRTQLDEVNTVVMGGLHIHISIKPSSPPLYYILHR
jgi:hypothetical protein